MIEMADQPVDMVEAKEAARHYRVPYDTIRTWIKRGKVRAYKQGRGRVFVERADIEEMLRLKPMAPKTP